MLSVQVSDQKQELIKICVIHDFSGYESDFGFSENQEYRPRVSELYVVDFGLIRK